MPIPILREVMQEPAMRHDYDLHIPIPIPILSPFHRFRVLAKLQKHPPPLPRSGLDRLRPRRPHPLITIPALVDPPQIHAPLEPGPFPPELRSQHARRGARVAGQIARLLEFREREDLHPRGDLGGEGEEAGVEGAAERGGHEVRDLLRVGGRGRVGGECFREGGALGFPEGGEGGVVDGVGGGVEVVVLRI